MAIRRPMRRRLMGTHTMSLTRPAPARNPGSGSLTVLAGFALILATGTTVLTLPISNQSGEWTHPYDAFFTAVSAICVTGLVVVDTPSHWSAWGEACIVVLIQVGGLGYMFGTSLILWILGRRLGLRDTYMLRLYYGAPSMGETFRFARRLVVFAVGIEAVGAAGLWAVFVLDGLPADRALWWSVFHSVSAFNNAGFSITGNDLIPYRNDAAVLLIISGLVILGGIGAVPFFALAERRAIRRLPLDAKLIFGTTIILLAVSTLYLLAVEWNNPATLGSATPAHRPTLAFFQAAVPRTAGFTAIDIVDLHDETKFAEMALMLIGGAAGSTAGGIKVGTFSLLFFAIVAALRGRQEVTALGRRIPQLVIYQAITIVLLAIAVAFLIALALLSLTDFRDIDVLFESLSAVGTVGLTTGVTQASNEAARAVLITGMLLGRYGPLLLVLEMTRPRQQSTFRLPDDSIRLG
jgi:trk system potassium uptake protein TrkH